MKKIYLSPATMVVNVELQHIIAASLNDVNDSGGTATLTDEEAESGTPGMSRHTNVWEEEEEEEY